MNSKVLLLSVAVVAVGLFALPSTMSLFSGQHTFYDGKNVSCAKCHQDIYDELKNPANTVHKSKSDCSGCHRTGTGSGADITNNTWKLDRNGIANVSIKAHAAVTVECLACHGRVGNDKEWGVAEQIQSASEAHRGFYYAAVSDKEIGDINQATIAAAQVANGSTPSPTWYNVGTGTASAPEGNQTVIKLKGTNTACVGCHTHAMVNITWSRSIGYEMTVNATNAGMDIGFTGVSGTMNTTTTSRQ